MKAGKRERKGRGRGFGEGLKKKVVKLSIIPIKMYDARAHA